MTVPEPMEEGAAVEAAAQVMRAEYVASGDLDWNDLAKAALDAISYPALLAELSRQAAVVEAARRLRDAHPSANTGTDLDLYTALAALDTP